MMRAFGSKQSTEAKLAGKTDFTEEEEEEAIRNG